MASEWKHHGEFEQPYYTDCPKIGAKSKIKWADLVLAKRVSETAHRIVWIELKDIGRSRNTIRKNAGGIGRDLAALWALRPSETQQIWADPPADMIDRDRVPEWKRLAPTLINANHLISQIVIAPKEMEQDIFPDAVENLWLDAFKRRITPCKPRAEFIIGRSETERFRVYALVIPLQEHKE